MTSRIRSAERLRIEVIDALSGHAAAGMRVDVFTLGARARKLCAGIVNADGVVDAPVLATVAIAPGEFEVVFHVGDYFRDRVTRERELPFLDIVPIRFAIVGPATYVLPVRIEPWGLTLDRRRPHVVETADVERSIRSSPQNR